MSCPFIYEIIYFEMTYYHGYHVIFQGCKWFITMVTMLRFEQGCKWFIFLGYHVMIQGCKWFMLPWLPCYILGVSLGDVESRRSSISKAESTRSDTSRGAGKTVSRGIEQVKHGDRLDTLTPPCSWLNDILISFAFNLSCNHCLIACDYE